MKIIVWPDLNITNFDNQSTLTRKRLHNIEYYSMCIIFHSKMAWRKREREEERERKRVSCVWRAWGKTSCPFFQLWRKWCLWQKFTTDTTSVQLRLLSLSSLCPLLHNWLTWEIIKILPILMRLSIVCFSVACSFSSGDFGCAWCDAPLTPIHLKYVPIVSLFI